MTDSITLLAALLLLVANAFFVGAEFALISARRDRLEPMAETSGRARLTLRAGGQLSLMLAAAQLGITICSLGLGSLGEPAIAHLLERLFGPLGMPTALLHAIAFVLALGVVTVAHILLGEMVPKNIAIAGPERAAVWLVPALVGWVRIARPVITLLNWAANHVLLAFRVHPRDELDPAYTADELANLIADSTQEGLLDQQERRRLTQTLASAEQTVSDVLLPVQRMVTLPVGVHLGAVERAVSDTGFSRYPVRDGDRLVGYLHLKDVLALAGQHPESPVPLARVRTLPDVAADARLDEALTVLRRASAHLGRVVDGDGSTLGVVALEDLVEKYVGTVRDATHVTHITPNTRDR